jgi:hypothetical protein
LKPGAPGWAEPAEDVPPNPAALIESMRAFGYSLPTALADLIDNSLSAGARRISIVFEWADGAPLIAVIDDGRGMDERRLIEAMRLGSRSPVEQRAADDLGRFGLGLKSAAWSQARRLTVVTRADGAGRSARCWDLDHVTSTGRWSLLATGTKPAMDVADHHLGDDCGTAVILENLDRLVGIAADEEAERRFLAHVRRTHEHLAMVFHRFLTARGRISLAINGAAVEPWDPFMEDVSATQPLSTESLPLGAGRVEVAPFVLPHVSKLTAEQHRAGAGPAGWNQQQGFYIYRARRLLVAGGWLGLRRMQREEHYKLARVRVDLDNSMDEAWQIDVRKATARIPPALEADLRRIASVTRQRAADAYRFRGKAMARAGKRTSSLSFVWQTTKGRNGATAFRVNRDHPVLRELSGGDTEVARAVERALRLVEENLPLETIVMDSREHPDSQRPRPFDGEPGTVLEMLRQVHTAMVRSGATSDAALVALAAIEPFDAHLELLQSYREETA